MDTEPISRRQALGGAAAAGVVLPLLAACSSGSGVAEAPQDGASSASPSDTAAAAAGGALVATADVPVGGGIVLADQKVVVTQPTAGDFRAFSAVCTHQGCIVSKVADGLIECPCHLSEFKITDGSPTSGPAPSPLEQVQIDVADGKVRLA